MEMGLRQTVLSDPQPGGGWRLARKPGPHHRVSSSHAGGLRSRLPAARTRKKGIGKALKLSDHGPRLAPPTTRAPAQREVHPRAIPRKRNPDRRNISAHFRYPQKDYS